MTWRTVILWGLVAGQMLVAPIAFVVLDRSSNGWIIMVGQALFICQFYLAGIWVAFGHRSRPWRLVAVGILLTCLTRFPGVGNWPPFLEFIFIFSPGVLTPLASLLLLRLLGFRLYWQGGESQTDNPGKLQFSLRSVLEWTAVTAILFSLTSLVHPNLVELADHCTWRELVFLVLIHLVLTVACVAQTAIVLGLRRFWIGLALLLPPALAFFSLRGWILSLDPVVMMLGAYAAAWFPFALLPLRLLGYRFGRCRSQQKEEAVSP